MTRRRKKSDKKKNRLAVVVVLSVFVLGLVVGSGAWRYIRDNRLGNFEDKVDLYVYPRMTPEDVIKQLENKTVIRHPEALRRVFEEKQVAEFIKPGYYVVKPSTPSVGLARMLNNGWQTPVNLVLSGSLRSKDEIATKISNQLMIEKSVVRRALDDKELLSGYGMTPATVFALFIPDTYNCYWSASINDILDLQKKAYDAFWSAENLKKAKTLGLSQEEVSVLASIVQGESQYEPEQPKIAGVYLNRLSKGMLLQADPTVAFCFDYKPNRILLRHLKVDSPYNTYKYGGLPPGPICVPSRSCLNAVLNPDRRDGYLFFCANPDFSGTHVFAKTLSEHGSNARAFQKELTRRSKEKGR